MNRLRAVARLLRAVAHALYGVAIVLTTFRSMTPQRKLERIQWWARKMLAEMGVALQFDERAPVVPGTLLVANHISWLDIMAVHAVCPQARFVSKADVRHWPIVSRLVDAANTLYLERERKRDALRVVHVMAEALRDREIVAVFPEGTTTDGRAMLPFHANLLQAAISTEAPVQPVALRYFDAASPISSAVEYIGDTTLMESVWRIACGEGVVAHVTLLPPRASAHAERRALAAEVRGDIESHLQTAN